MFQPSPLSLYKYEMIKPILVLTYISRIQFFRVISQNYLVISSGTFVKNLRQKFQDFLANASTTAEECISSIRTVRSFVGEDKSLTTYAHDIDKSYGVGSKLSLAQGLLHSCQLLRKNRSCSGFQKKI